MYEIANSNINRALYLQQEAEMKHKEEEELSERKSSQSFVKEDSIYDESDNPYDDEDEAHSFD